MERARAAGAVGLIVTLDWSFANGRDWGSPIIPEQIDLKAALRLAPEARGSPAVAACFAKTGRMPELTMPNMADPGQPAPNFFGAYGRVDADPARLRWEDVAWLR